MNCLKALREAARVEINPVIRNILIWNADSVQTWIQDLANDASTENMIGLNGAWIRAKVALDMATPVPDPTSPVATMEEERKAA